MNFRGSNCAEGGTYQPVVMYIVGAEPASRYGPGVQLFVGGHIRCDTGAEDEKLDIHGSNSVASVGAV